MTRYSTIYSTRCWQVGITIRKLAERSIHFMPAVLIRYAALNKSLVSLQRALAPIRGLKTKADLQRTIFEGAHSSPQVHVSIRMVGNTIFYLAIRRFLTDGDGICLVDFYQAHVFKCVQPALHGQHIPFLLVPCSILNNRIKMI